MERSTGVSMSRAIYKFEQDLWPNHLPQILHCTLVIRRALRAYERQLSTIHSNAKATREAFLHELHERIALCQVHTNNPEKALANINSQLRSTKTFRAIKRAVK